MTRHSRIRYVRGYGYIRCVYKYNGDGIADIFSTIWKSGRQILTKIPNKLIDASKDALLNVGSTAIKAVGSRVGDTIADKITKKNIEPSKTPDQDMRQKILKELTFDHPVKTSEVNDNNMNKESINTNTDGISSDHYTKFYGSGKSNSKKRGKTLHGSGIKIL